MRATIDQAGRLVIPKSLRRELGLVPGEVNVTRDGAVLRIEPIAGEGTIDVGGRLVIDAEVTLTDEDVREMRFTDQR
jgi:AbrB family looped-hinge helix DNA binding protein